MRLGISAPVVALISAGLIASGAHAAISVLGNGMSHDCYVRADRGVDARGGEEICTAALNFEPLSVRNRAATFVNRGVIRGNLRRYQDALDDYGRAIGFGRYLLDKDLGVAYVDRSSVLNARGRYREALEDVNKGLSLGTARPEIAYYNRAIAEEALGNVKGAYLDYKQALTLAPSFTEAAEELKRFRVVTKPADGT